jgi:hypothetical protein
MERPNLPAAGNPTQETSHTTKCHTFTISPTSLPSRKLCQFIYLSFLVICKPAKKTEASQLTPGGHDEHGREKIKVKYHLDIWKETRKTCTLGLRMVQ